MRVVTGRTGGRHAGRPGPGHAARLPGAADAGRLPPAHRQARAAAGGAVRGPPRPVEQPRPRAGRHREVRGRRRPGLRHPELLLHVRRGVPDLAGALRLGQRPLPADLVGLRGRRQDPQRRLRRHHRRPGRRPQGARQAAVPPLVLGDGRRPVGEVEQGRLPEGSSPPGATSGAGSTPGAPTTSCGSGAPTPGASSRTPPSPSTPATSGSTGSAPTGTTGRPAARRTGAPTSEIFDSFYAFGVSPTTSR